MNMNGSMDDRLMTSITRDNAADMMMILIITPRYVTPRCQAALPLLMLLARCLLCYADVCHDADAIISRRLR